MIDRAGRYNGTMVEAVLGVAGTGSEQIGALFQLTDHPDEYVTWYGSFKSDDSTAIALKALRACGWTGDDLSAFNGGALPAEMAGKVVTLVIEIDYGTDGLPRPKVKWVNSGGGVAMKTVMTQDQLGSFAQRMKARIRSLEGGAPRSGPRPVPAPPRKADSDDIPF